MEAVKAGGASDYIRKSPGLVDEIKLAIRRVLENLTLSKQNFALRRDAASHNSLDNIRQRRVPKHLKLRERRSVIARPRQNHRLQPRDGEAKANRPHRGFHRQHRADSWRKWYG